MSDRAYTACCVWEELLAGKARGDQGIERDFEQVGTVAMRQTAVAWAELAEEVWAKLGGDSDSNPYWDCLAFDWDFIPDFVRALYEVGSIERDITDYMRKHRPILLAGVEAVGLDDPAKLHNTIARAVGEDDQ